MTDYERLILDVWTDGTITPEEGVSLAALLLQEHLFMFVNSEESMALVGTVDVEQDTGLEIALAKRIDELDLSVRSANCLKNANILTLRDLVARTEREMLETKNFGKKSLVEVQSILDELGLHFGMSVGEEVTDEILVASL